MNLLSMIKYFLVPLILMLVTLIPAAQASPAEEAAGVAYLAGIAKQENVITLKSGMLVEILKSGELSGKSPKASDSCKVTYL